MTQPSISQHIRALERHFDTQLFIRQGKTIALTDAGKMLMPLARSLVNMSLDIEETMNMLKGEVYGQLLVGCSTTPGKYVLPMLLAEFHQRYPKVQVSCRVSGQEESLKLLFDGEINIALTSFIQPGSKEAIFVKFISDPVELIAPIDHPWAAPEDIEPQRLTEGKFIMREENSGTYRAVTKELAQAGILIDELNTMLTLGNSEAIALSVAEGLGVGFVSHLVVSNLSQGRIKAIRIRGLEICQNIYIGYQTRNPASPAQVAFKRFMESNNINRIGL